MGIYVYMYVYIYIYTHIYIYIWQFRNHYVWRSCLKLEGLKTYNTVAMRLFVRGLTGVSSCREMLADLAAIVDRHPVKRALGTH